MANVPKIRFPGFTEPWEQRKFSELVVTRRGLTYSPNDIRDNGVRVLRSSNIDEDRFSINDDDVFVRETAVNIPTVCNGDILITSANGSSRLVGKHAIIDGIPDNSAVHGGFMLAGSARNPYFANALMSSSWYQKFISIFVAGGNGAIGNLNKNDLDEQLIMVPSEEEEQDMIGYYFRTLDNLITLHQSKLDDLKKMNRGLLQKMFPAEGSNVPKIRFPGFTDPWEQRKVGEVIEDYVEKTTVQNQYPVLTSSQQQGIVLQEDYFADRQVTTNDNVGYYVLPRGYFTYRSRSDTDLFVFNRNNLIDKGIISYYYPVFRPKNVDSNFLLRRLNNGIRSQVSMVAEGTGQHVLAYSKLKNMEFLVPSVPEQKLIGAYFENLDNLITLHQHKLDDLKELKKGLLQQMFVD